jgi:hypothetical protein|eukprot:2937403-Prymnesium_polylepis.1
MDDASAAAAPTAAEPAEAAPSTPMPAATPAAAPAAAARLRADMTNTEISAYITTFESAAGTKIFQEYAENLEHVSMQIDLDR